MYLQLKQIPLWPPRGLCSGNVFRIKYPTMTVIIDATEITLEQPAIPELQQLTLSNYKSRNTYRLTPFGAVTFVSDLYSGFISDKKLT